MICITWLMDCHIISCCTYYHKHTCTCNGSWIWKTNLNCQLMNSRPISSTWNGRRSRWAAMLNRRVFVGPCRRHFSMATAHGPPISELRVLGHRRHFSTAHGPPMLDWQKMTLSSRGAAHSWVSEGLSCA